MTERRYSKAEILLLDALCDQFERAAHRGEGPRIEDFLPKAPEEIQPRLFEELLRYEVAGESKSDASSDTYIERFPQYAHIVREHWPDRAEDTISTPGTGARANSDFEASTDTVREFASAGKDSRYTIVKTHAKGGLGEVFIAEDLDLHRRVALKEIQPFAADDPESRARFLLEAEITGRLEHPGIVPVYSLGASAKGRPYYAMRFIQGESLKEAIEKHHAKNHQDLSEKAVEFRQLLSRFVAVCQAVAFAHDRGILHRDLKPANIMLGKFGETLVVDWGLAKVLGKSTSDFSSVSTLIPKRQDDSSETRHGAVVGTPAYMSPEQARGEIDGLGPTSDIYSLGATLFSIVTGERPVQGQSTAELLRNVREGKTELSNRSHKGASLSLLAICRKAMARESTHRYLTALALAVDLERWLADEPVEAYRESAMTQVRRWIKRHTTAVSTASAALLVLILALAGGSVALGFKNTELQEANKKQTKATQAAENAQKAEEKARKAAEKAQKEAQIAQRAAEKAQKNTEIALKAAEKAEKESKLAQAAAEASAKEEKAANEVAQRRLAQVREHNLVLKEIFSDINPQQGVAEGVTLSEQLAKRLIEASKRLTANSVDDEVQVSGLQSTLGITLMQLGYPKEAIDLHAKALDTSTRTMGAEHPNTLVCMDNLASAYGADHQNETALSLFEKTLEMRRRILGPSDKDTLRTMNNMAAIYERIGQVKKSLSMKETNYILTKNLLGEEHQDTLIALGSLAAGYLAAGQFPKSIELHQQLHDKWLAKHGADHDLVVNAKANLACALTYVRDFDKAIPLFEAAIVSSKKTLGDDHPTTLAAMTNCAIALNAAGKTDRALAMQEDTLAKHKSRFGADHPNTLVSMSGLAHAYLSANQLDKSMELFEKLLELNRQRYSEEHIEYARTLFSYGRANLHAKNYEKALSLYERSYAIYTARLGVEHRDTIRVMHDLAVGYLRANAYEKGKQVIKDFVTLRRKLAPLGDAVFIELLSDLGIDHSNAKQYSEAEGLFRESLELRKLYGKEPWRAFQVQSLLGGALAEQKKFAEAERNLLEAYDGLKSQADKIPAGPIKPLPTNVNMLIKLYKAQDKTEEVERWTKVRDELPK